jgi:phosphopantetheine--protein transferase-like protein
VSETFVGTDIVSVPKIKSSIYSSSNIRFLNRIFTESEIIYCQNKAIPEIHFAGRFAAKEAITKALLSSEIINSVKMKSIEISSGSDRIPIVNLNIELKIEYKCKVSISHTNDNAIAFAIFQILK